MLRLAVLLLYLVLFFLLVRLTTIRDLKTLMGRPPISPGPFAAGKIAMGIVWIYSILGADGLVKGWFESAVLEQIGLTITLIGLAISATAIFNFGGTLTMGLPEGPLKASAELKTSGLYRFSRNPMYLGFYLTCVGTSLYVPDLIVWSATVATVIIHDRIVRAEEAYLAKRYGEQWEEYRKKVRRYI